MSGEGLTNRSKAQLASAQIAAAKALEVAQAMVMPPDEEPDGG
jgi:hypothetical protein